MDTWPRFELRVNAAAQWVTDMIVAFELGEADTDAAGRVLPLIGMGWDPHACGQEDNVRLLVRAAQTEVRGAAPVLCAPITGPLAASIDIEHLDDGDDWAYRFVLSVRTPAPLTVAAMPHPITGLGDPAATGVQAALAVLDEARAQGNTLLAQLTAFLAAARP